MTSSQNARAARNAELKAVVARFVGAVPWYFCDEKLRPIVCRPLYPQVSRSGQLRWLHFTHIAVGVRGYASQSIALHRTKGIYAVEIMRVVSLLLSAHSRMWPSHRTNVDDGDRAKLAAFAVDHPEHLREQFVQGPHELRLALIDELLMQGHPGADEQRRTCSGHFPGLDWPKHRKHPFEGEPVISGPPGTTSPNAPE